MLGLAERAPEGAAPGEAGLEVLFNAYERTKLPQIASGLVMRTVGTPLEVYGNPANRFVAGFIGAPSMNFLNVKISEEGPGLFAEAPFLRLALPQFGNRALAGWRGKEVLMGMRPEHLSLGSDISQCCFEAGVEVVEQLGSEIILETRVGDARVTVARVDPQVSFRVGETVRLSVQPERLHFFDPVTEVAIR